MTAKDIYNMTLEENIFCAKRILIDSIYQQANLEGIGVTFAETQDIINNVNVANINSKDIGKVCCLRDGNKRVGSYAINKILIQNGKGIFNVRVEYDGTFKQILADYYSSNANSIIKNFIAEKCITGTTGA